MPLADFVHPERCVYVLGAEDQGLPPAVVRACTHCVSLSNPNPNPKPDPNPNPNPSPNPNQVRACTHCVSLECAREASFNVALTLPFSPSSSPSPNGLALALTLALTA